MVFLCYLPKNYRLTLFGELTYFFIVIIKAYYAPTIKNTGGSKH
jgi:hypothetical protein